MGGLAAAAAVARHFDRVVILDKDQLPDGPEPRLGVGQGHHLHNLLKGGELSIEKLLPGACAELLAPGRRAGTLRHRREDQRPGGVAA
jgi:hypothetical protein